MDINAQNRPADPTQQYTNVCEGAMIPTQACIPTEKVEHTFMLLSSKLAVLVAPPFACTTDCIFLVCIHERIE